MDGSMLHYDVATEVAGTLSRRDDVLAVLLGGSVARGEHQPSSDVDLFVVGTDELDLPTRQSYQGLLVERIGRTEQDWQQHFDRPKTSWLYAWLEAIVLYDSGPATRLQYEARRVQTSYRASAELKSLLATLLWHSQAKLDRVRPDDYRSQGFWSSIFVETIIDAIYTVHNVPLPAGS